MENINSISVGSHFEKFIRREVASGKYSSASEVVETALRLLEEEEIKLQKLRSSLEEGEDSGMVDGFDSEDYLKQLHKKHL